MSNSPDNQTIFGIHSVKEALESGVELGKIIIQRDVRNDVINEIVGKARTKGVPVQFVPREKFLFLRNKTHQGIAAFLSSVEYQSLENIVPLIFESGKVPLILILDRITDVRNFGAIARSAYCAGVDAIVIPETGSAQINDDAVKTSAGALLKIPVCREKHLKTSIEFLNQCGFTTIACSEKARKNIDEMDFNAPIAIIMGNEETGISTDLIRKCGELAKIPLESGVQSLNVSVAAGIILYECVRQRA